MTLAIIIFVIIGLYKVGRACLDRLMDDAFKAIDAHQKEGPWE